MPNRVTINELKEIGERLDLPIKHAVWVSKKRVKGFWFRYKDEENSIWSKFPNLDNVAAYYTLVDIANEEKEVDKYPAKIKYIHWRDVLLFQLAIHDKINEIKKKTITIDEEDEAYIILKYL